MSAYEGGLNFYPDPPPERWRELYMEAAAEIERLRADLARAEADARRWRRLRAMVSGQRDVIGRPVFGWPGNLALPAPKSLMRGSVAQHLDNAMDAAIAAQ